MRHLIRAARCMLAEDFPSDITLEMAEFFNYRLDLHCGLVRKYAGALEGLTPPLGGLLAVADKHDDSKYHEPELLPYIRLTWWYKEHTGTGERPPKDLLGDVWQHHLEVNDHHPEFWPEPAAMTDIALAHMVCDLAAMAAELKTGLWDWITQVTLRKYKWTGEQAQKIMQYAEHLHAQFADLPWETGADFTGRS